MVLGSNEKFQLFFVTYFQLLAYISSGYWEEKKRPLCWMGYCLLDLDGSFAVPFFFGNKQNGQNRKLCGLYGGGQTALDRRSWLRVSYIISRYFLVY